MFKKARLKLTALYLAIIMIISLSFSAFIYHSIGHEFQRRFNVIENRLELRKRGFRPPLGQAQFFIDDLKEARQRLLLVLFYTNSGIFIFSAAAGYFLAGKTLHPIEEVMEEQKRFVADASHELKTPLTALTTSIEVALRDKKLSLKEAKKVLKSSLEETKSLSQLANNLLSLTRYQQNDNFVFEKLDIKKVIQTVAKKITPLAKKKNIVFSLESKSSKLTANSESLEKLITILLDNAVKYTPKGGKVSLTTKKSKKYLVIKVSDTGAGIAKKDLPYVFDRFYRADISRSKVDVDLPAQAGGFGLGLSMAKQIIDLHSGSISVKSEVGKGSTFTVKLPV